MGKQGESPDWLVPRFKGRKVLIAGQVSGYEKRELAERIEREGGKVVPKLAPAVDYVLVAKPRGTPGAVKEAQKLNKKGASIQVIDEAAFEAMLLVSADDARAMLTGGKRGLDRWRNSTPTARRPRSTCRASTCPAGTCPATASASTGSSSTARTSAAPT